MGNWEADWDCDVLKRIVVLLFSLANLADLAAGAPFLRRRRVLGIVSHSEAEARAFVIGMVSGELIPIDALEPASDATCLAVRLRALALMLCLLLAQAAQSTLPHTAGPHAGRCKPAVPAGRPAPPPANDTS